MPTTQAVPEGGMATLHVCLATAPAAPVAVRVALAPGPDGVTVPFLDPQPATVVLDAATWQSGVAVQVGSAWDADTQGQTMTLRLAADGLADHLVTLTQADAGVPPRARLVAQTVRVPEGGSATVAKVRLSANPQAPVEVALRVAGDPDLLLDGPASVTLDASTWNTGVAVVMRALTDADDAVGTAVLTATPQAGVADALTISEGERARRILVDCGDALLPGPGWNVIASASGVTAPLVDEQGQATALRLEFGSGFAASADGWPQPHDQPAGIGDDAAIVAAPGSATIRLAGLSANTGYAISLGASTSGRAWSRYQCQSLPARVQDNDTNMGRRSVTFPNVVADAQGRITVTMTADADAPHAALGWLTITRGATTGRLDLGSLPVLHPAWLSVPGTAVTAGQTLPGTSWTAAVVTPFSGTTTLPNEGYAYPVNTVHDGFVVNRDRQGIVTCLGLDPAARVRVRLLGSDGGTTARARYAVGAEERSQNHYRNTAAVAEFTDLHADAQGRLAITVQPADADASRACLSVIEIVYEEAVRPVLSVSSQQVAEDGSAALTVRLDRAVAATTQVALSLAGDASVQVTPALLTFGTQDWSVPQTITLVAQPDADTADGQAMLTAQVAGAAAATAAITAVDDDPRLVVEATTLLVPEGGPAQVRVHLDRDPGGDLTIQVERIDGDGDLAAETAAIAIPRLEWQQARPVVIHAADDADASDGTAAFRLRLDRGVPGSPGFSRDERQVTAREVDDCIRVRIDLGGTMPPAGVVGWNGIAPTQVGPITGLVDHTGQVLPLTWSLASAAGSSLNSGLPADDWATRDGIRWTGTRTITLAGFHADERPTLRLYAATSEVQTGVKATVGTAMATLTATGNTGTWAELPDLVPQGGAVVAQFQAVGSQGCLNILEYAFEPAPRPIVSAMSVQVPEDGSAMLTVALTRPPRRPLLVTCTRTGGDGDLTVADGASCWFTAVDWAQPRTLRIAAAADADRSAGQAEFRIAAGMQAVMFTAVESDDDAGALGIYRFTNPVDVRPDTPHTDHTAVSGTVFTAVAATQVDLRASTERLKVTGWPSQAPGSAAIAVTVVAQPGYRLDVTGVRLVTDQRLAGAPRQVQWQVLLGTTVTASGGWTAADQHERDCPAILSVAGNQVLTFRLKAGGAGSATAPLYIDDLAILGQAVRVSGVAPENDPPVNLLPPRIVGVPQPGTWAEAERGLWVDDGDSPLGLVGYAWTWEHAATQGGTGAQALTASGDRVLVTNILAGRWLRVRVTASDDGRQSATAASAWTQVAGQQVPMHTVTFAAGPVAGGTVSAPAVQQVAHGGAAQAVTATPAAGWRWVGWEPTTFGLDPTLRLDAVLSDLTLTARFAPEAPQPVAVVTVTVTGQGTVVPGPVVTVAPGGAVTLTATPAPGWLFASWRVAGKTRTGNPVLLEAITESVAVTARFIKPQPAAQQVVVQGTTTGVVSELLVQGGSLSGDPASFQVVLPPNGAAEVRVTRPEGTTATGLTVTTTDIPGGAQ
jgi:hypothetical protein